VTRRTRAAPLAIAIVAAIDCSLQCVWLCARARALAAGGWGIVWHRYIKAALALAGRLRMQLVTAALQHFLQAGASRDGDCEGSTPGCSAELAEGWDELSVACTGDDFGATCEILHSSFDVVGRWTYLHLAIAPNSVRARALDWLRWSQIGRSLVGCAEVVWWGTGTARREPTACQTGPSTR
jgi:hypothetical protein